MKIFNSEFNFLYECFINEKNENKFTDNGLYEEEIKKGNDLIKEKKENKCFIKPKNTWNKKEKNIFENQNFQKEFNSILLNKILSIYCNINDVKNNLNELENEPIYSYIEKIMKKIKNNILSDSKEIFNELLNNINRDYFY